jgi:hypothetical protein
VRGRAATLVGALVLVLGAATHAAAQRGGFGGVGGGGMRPTGGSSMGYNRAGTASSGGFAYGDAPRSQPTVAVTQGATPTAPCDVAPVSVDGKPYYKCGGSWYAPALTDTGIVYSPVPPPPGT